MLIFKTISFRNFLASGNIPTKITLNEHHTTILLGESGAGKTTLLDAICFSLFNKPFRNISKNTLTNSINQKECVVEIEFDVDNRSYKIIRGLKPNIFEIYCNDQLINPEADARDYQQYLENQILKVNYRSFIQIVVLGASNFTPFMLLKPADRRLIIEELLDIKIFSVMNLLLKQEMNNLKNEIQTNENDLFLLEEKIKVHEKYLLDLKEDNQNQISELRKKIEENIEHIKSLKQEIEEFNELVILKNKELEEEQKLDKNISEFVDLQNKIQEKQKQTKKEIEFYETNEACSKCKQKIHEDFKNKEIEVKTNILNEIEEALSKTEEKLNDLREKKEFFLPLHEDIKNYGIEANKKNISLLATKDFINKLKDEYEKLLKPTTKINEEKEQLVEYKNNIDLLHNKKEQLIVERNIQDLASGLLKDNGIKAQIVKQYLPIINKYTNKYLQEMSFFATFQMDENFNELIKFRGRDEFSFESFSDGQKQRISLALLFTWREIAKIKNSINTNLLILDEVADSSLDLDSTENFLNLLTSNTFKNLNIIMISHKQTIADKFDRVIRFKIERNFSRMMM